MNYIKEINAFYERVEFVPLSSSAVSLWHTLLHINNKARWQRTFTASSTVLRMKSGLKESSFKRARKELKEKGYIDYESRLHNLAPIYRLVELSAVDGGVDLDVLSDEDGNRSADQHVDPLKNRNRAPLDKQDEKKRNEYKIEDAAAAVTFYVNDFGGGEVSPYIRGSIVKWVDHVGEDLVIEAMGRALERGKANWSYVKGILENCEKKGIGTVEGAKEEARSFSVSRKGVRVTNNVRREVVPEWFDEYQRRSKEEARWREQEIPKVSAAMVEELMAERLGSGGSGS